MADKPAKIDDIKRPEKVAPEATSRPLLVTNRPTLTNDPMMAQPSGEDKGEGASDIPMTHTARTIKPINVTLETDKSEASENAQKSDAVADEKPTEEAAPEDPKPAASMRSQATPGLPATADSDDDSDGSKRDPDAAITAEEAAAAEAKAKRDEELEGIIASGKYAVPINAVQRKRSQVNTIVLSLLTLLLAVALIDMAADVGVFRLPANIPHTHYFSAK